MSTNSRSGRNAANSGSGQPVIVTREVEFKRSPFGCRSASWLNGLEPDARTVADFKAAFTVSVAAANVPASQLAAELSLFDDMPEFWNLPRPDIGADRQYRPEAYFLLPAIWMCITSVPTSAIKRLIDLCKIIIPLPLDEAKLALRYHLRPLLHDMREYQVSTEAVAELLPWLLNSYAPDADVFVYSTVDRVCTVVRVAMNADTAQIEQAKQLKLVRDANGFLTHFRPNVQIGRMCFWCESAPTKGPLLQCGGCKKVFYCSKKCQKIDWNAEHRNECKLEATQHHASGEISISALDIESSECPSRMALEAGVKETHSKIFMAAANGLLITRVGWERGGDEQVVATGWVGEVEAVPEPKSPAVSSEESAMLLTTQPRFLICRPAAWLHGLKPDARTVANFKAAFAASAAAANVPASQLGAELSVFDDIPVFWRLPGATVHRGGALLMLPGIWMCIASMPTPAIKRLIDLCRVIIPLPHFVAKDTLSRLLPSLLRDMHEDGVATEAAAELLQWLLNSCSPDADVFVYSTVDRICTVVRVGMNADMAQIEKEICNPNSQIGKMCFWCESAPTKGRLLACSRCNKVLYCSQRCQKMDWTAEHRIECKLKTAMHHPNGAMSVPAAEIDLRKCPSRLALETTKSNGALRIQLVNVQDLLIERLICSDQPGCGVPLPTGWICRVKDPSEPARNTVTGSTAVAILQLASRSPHAMPAVVRALKHVQKLFSRALVSRNQFPIVKISPSFFRKFFLASK
jgi:hypothetical protein